VAFFALLSVDATASPRDCLVAAIIFIIAAATDALDGHLARRWNAISQFGRVMDPFADKILVVGAFVILAGPAFLWASPDSTPRQASGIAPWMAVLVLARELLVTSLRAVLESQGRDFSATTSGKLKMVAQSFAVPAILLLCALADPFHSSTRAAILTIAYATVAITLVSGVPYVRRALATPPVPTPPR
jgi:CDP-diacylglycerol--glycerol-3-phosphate 3-phosphatidyltransferase